MNIKRFIASTVFLGVMSLPNLALADNSSLWKFYDETLKSSKYIDLTHAFEPQQPVWPGFANARFKPAVAGQDIEGYVKAGEEFTYEKHGFVASAYDLTTDQYGTQLDPPSHWNPLGASISDLPATYAVRPLVVIDISGKVATDEGYHLQVSDIEGWEAKHGRIPEGSVVFVRSDWYKKWSDPARFNQKPFPGVSLDALKFLHLERKILFHGHEPLDTDTTPNLEGEHWLLHNDFAQAEGVANLDKVPEAGALLTIGFAKPLGGSGGYARYIAIAPADWKEGVSINDAPGAPLAKQTAPLKRDANGVFRPTP
ncbi:cyclase family protein [Phyllobacterium sp. SB3]|uniref:cyclase family protein n=1 Tax=Phyllobacterium sp. SB3 TaxID=3156073 RepID=UPI0032AEEC32